MQKLQAKFTIMLDVYVENIELLRTSDFHDKLRSTSNTCCRQRQMVDSLVGLVVQG
jgi:hypothetical protein